MTRKIKHSNQDRRFVGVTLLARHTIHYVTLG